MKTLRALAVGMLCLGAISFAVAWKAESPAIESADAIVAPLAAPGPKYWKGNLHTHSLWSDGDDFPEMIADWYKRHGYNFLTLSEHNLMPEGRRWIATKGRDVALGKYLKRFGPAWVERRTEKGVPQVRLKPLAEYRGMLESPGQFLMIPGEEITHRFAKAPVHLNGINLRDVVAPVDGDNVSETIRANLRQVQEQNKRTGIDMLTFLNHPNYLWGVRAEDIARAEELRFFEIYNGHPLVYNEGKEGYPGTERMWDIALALRLGKSRLPIIYGTATDDAHRYHRFDKSESNPGRGWIMVKAPYLSPETIVRAMNAGEFYLSTGVILADVGRDRDKLSLAIKTEPGVAYTTQFIATFKDADLAAQQPDAKSPPVYGADVGKVVATSDSPTPSYRVTGQELYVRAKVTSTKSQPNPIRTGDVETAWTQPWTP